LNVMPPVPKKASVNVENVRICKLQGGSVDQCHVINGMVNFKHLHFMFL
jgi:chaperonin GroEL (HSP60 family)